MNIINNKLPPPPFYDIDIPNNKIGIIRKNTLYYLGDKFSEVFTIMSNNDSVKFGRGTFELDEMVWYGGSANWCDASFYSHYTNNPNKRIKYITGYSKDSILNIRSDIINKDKRDNHIFSTHGNIITNLVFNWYMAPNKYCNALSRYCEYTYFSNIVVNTFGESDIHMYYCDGINPSIDYCIFENCTFNTNRDFIPSFTQGIENYGYCISCVFTKNTCDGSITDCISNQTIDSNYKLINGDNSKYGVYSGEYAWK